MPDLPSRLDFFQLGRDYVVQRATKIDPAQVDIQGSDVNIYVGVASTLAFHITKQLAYSINKLLLDGAEGEDLDRYAFDRYQMTRKGASAAVGFVVFSRPTNTAGGGTINSGTVLLTLNNVQYITTAAATFGATDLVTKPVPVAAVQAGKDTQVGAHYLVKFSVAPSFDPTITVDNAAATAGGEDQEDDDTFRERIRDFWNTARRGTLSAIEFGAKTVPGVTSAQAVEAITAGATPARVVLLYIADSSGVASDAQAQTVDIALEDYRAGGIAVIVSTSIPQIVAVSLHLTFRASVDTSTLSDNIRQAVMEYVNSLAVNQTLTKGAIQAVLQRYVSNGLLPDQSTIVTPAGDVVPDAGKTIRTNLDNVTVV